MAWTTPKTNWTASDYFNYSDFNRIKNNIVYLAAMPNPAVSITAMGNDRTVSSFPYADDFNKFQRNLFTIGEAVGIGYHNFPMFYINGPTPTYANLNQIESFILTLYNELSGSAVYAVDSNGLYGVVNGVKAKGVGS